MLRYFPLLCLLLFIQITFCYNYIAEQHTKKRVGNLRQRKYKVEDSRRLEKRHGGDGDSLAQIDLASFIQKPDYDAMADNDAYMKKQRNDLRYEFGSESHLASDDTLQKSVGDNSNLAIDAPEFDSKYSKLLTNQMNPTIEQNTIHKPQKKCAMKHIKVPFFSHKSTSTPKPKKSKKRKPAKKFCFGGKSKKKDVTGNIPKTSDTIISTKVPEETLNLRKRANYEKICPLCKRKMTEPNVDFHTLASNKLIHNSRQYYQHLGEVSKENTSDERRLKEYKKNAEQIDMRKKRDYTPDSEKERQLKELDDVRRRVDGVEIVTPRFQSQQTRKFLSIPE